MAKQEKVTFCFDRESLVCLRKLSALRQDASLNDTIRSSLAINQIFQEQMQAGFTEIVVRNSRTNEERVMILHDLLSTKEEQ